MKMIIAFTLLGIAFGFLFYLTVMLEHCFNHFLLSFTLDFLYAIIVSLSYICFVIGYGDANFRYYFFFISILGFWLYSVSIHKLLSKPATLLSRKINGICKKLSKKLLQYKHNV